MKESGKTPTQIARELGISRTTVYFWLRRWEEEENLKDKKRPGPSRRTTPEQDQAIIDAVEAGPFTNAVAVKEQLGLHVSADTVRRRLHEREVHHRTPAIKETLTDRHRENRLLFAQQHGDKGMDFWSRVIFTDEKTFRSTNHGRLHCWRRDGTRYQRQHIYEVQRSGHVTFNVWGWMHLYGLGELADIEGKFTADQYIEILEEVMLPSVRAYALPYPERILYVHDRSPIHTARVVTRWLQEQRNFEVLEWPSKACDLNPIENIWANIVNVWEPAGERTRERLRQHVYDEWEAMRRKPNIVFNHVSSMPDRLQLVIDSNGSWTRY